MAIVASDDLEHLSKTLASVSGFVDEVVIVGGEPIEGPTIRQYEFDNISDPRAARQFAFKKIRSDWVLWLEPGEVLTPLEITKVIEISQMPNASIFFLKVVEQSGFTSNSPRLFRSYIKPKFDSSENLRIDSNQIAKSRASSSCFVADALINSPDRDRDKLGDYDGSLQHLSRKIASIPGGSIDVSWIICKVLKNVSQDQYFLPETEFVLNFAWSHYNNRQNVLHAISEFEEKRNCLWYSFHAIRELVNCIEKAELDEDPDVDVRDREAIAYGRLAHLAKLVEKRDSEFKALSKLFQSSKIDAHLRSRLDELSKMVVS